MTILGADEIQVPEDGIGRSIASVDDGGGSAIVCFVSQ